MSALNIGLLIEGLVTVLLLLTIGFCFTLNRRLKMLRADELTMRNTVAELSEATMRAERAVAELRNAAHESETRFEAQIQEADRLTHELAAHRAASNEVVAKLAAITEAAGRPVAPRRPGRVGEAPLSSGLRTREGRAA